jgi:hypothetical protein
MSKGPVEIKDGVNTYVDSRSHATNAGTEIERIAERAQYE